MKRKIFSIILSLVLTFSPICSPVANASTQAPSLTNDFNVIGANGSVWIVPPSDAASTLYYYKLSDVSGTAPSLDSTDLEGYTLKLDTLLFWFQECQNGTTKYVQVIRVESSKIKAWGEKSVTPQPMVEYNNLSIDAHGLAITLERGTDPSKTKIYLNSDPSTPVAIFDRIGTLTPNEEGAYDLSNTKINGNSPLSNYVTTTSITMNGGNVLGIYGGSNITSSAAIVINGGSSKFILGSGTRGDETHKADIVITGGNVINPNTGYAAVEVVSGTDSTVTVNGGYIRYGDSPYNGSFIKNATPKNSVGNDVEKYILTVMNGGEAVTNTALSSLTTYPELVGYTYGVTDVKTDLNGKLFVFLPEGVSTVSVIAGGQTYRGTVESNAATLITQSTAPTADVTSITKTTSDQQQVSYTLTNSPPLSGTCTVYADNTTTDPISTVTAAISGTSLTLTDSDGPIKAGSYYVTVTEPDKSESTRLQLTIIEDLIVDITAASVNITAPVLGAIPQDAAAVEAATASAGYTVTGLVWNGALTAGNKFKAGQF